MNNSTKSSSLLRQLLVLLLILATPVFGVDFKVKVFTSFAKDQVTPNARVVTEGQNVNFTAPLYVYLDEQFKEQAISPEVIKGAIYRVRCAGFTMSDGELVVLPVDGASQVKVEVLRKVTSDLSITWLWELQYAFTIESETSTILAGSGNEGLGQPDPAVGKFWMSRGTSLTPSVDGVISAEANGVRFRIEGAEVEGISSVTPEELAGLGDTDDRYFSLDFTVAVILDTQAEGGCRKSLMARFRRMRFRPGHF